MSKNRRLYGPDFCCFTYRVLVGVFFASARRCMQFKILQFAKTVKNISRKKPMSLGCSGKKQSSCFRVDVQVCSYAPVTDGWINERKGKGRYKISRYADSKAHQSAHFRFDVSAEVPM